jgi:hypothetical protein
MASYEQQQQLNNMISEVNVDKTVSTVDTLASLKLIRSFQNPSESDKNTSAQKLAESELSYLNTAITAINSNEALSNKFGKSFEGALSLTSLLKQKQAQRTYDKIFNDILEKNDATKLDNVVNSLNRGKATTD